MDKWVPGAGGGESVKYKGVRGSILGWWAVLFLKSGGGHTTVSVCRNSQNHTLKRMNSTVCKICFNKPDQKQVYKSGFSVFPSFHRTPVIMPQNEEPLLMVVFAKCSLELQWDKLPSPISDHFKSLMEVHDPSFRRNELYRASFLMYFPFSNLKIITSGFFIGIRHWVW